MSECDARRRPLSDGLLTLLPPGWHAGLLVRGDRVTNPSCASVVRCGSLLLAGTCAPGALLAGRSERGPISASAMGRYCVNGDGAGCLAVGARADLDRAGEGTAGHVPFRSKVPVGAIGARTRHDGDSEGLV